MSARSSRLRRAGRLAARALLATLCAVVSLPVVARPVAAQTFGSNDGKSAVLVCANALTGEVRLSGATTPCRSSEVQVVWNIPGPPGPANGDARSTGFEGSGLVQACADSATGLLRVVTDNARTTNPGFTDSCLPTEEPRSWRIAGPAGQPFLDDDTSIFPSGQAVACADKSGRLRLVAFDVSVDAKDSCDGDAVLRWYLNGPVGPPGSNVRRKADSTASPITIPVPEASPSTSAPATTSAPILGVPTLSGTQAQSTDGSGSGGAVGGSTPAVSIVSETADTTNPSTTTTVGGTSTTTTVAGPPLTSTTTTLAPDPLDQNGPKLSDSVFPRVCYIGRRGSPAIGGRFGYVVRFGESRVVPPTATLTPAAIAKVLAQGAGRVPIGGAPTTTTSAANSSSSVAAIGTGALSGGAGRFQASGFGGAGGGAAGFDPNRAGTANGVTFRPDFTPQFSSDANTFGTVNPEIFVPAVNSTGQNTILGGLLGPNGTGPLGPQTNTNTGNPSGGVPLTNTGNPGDGNGSTGDGSGNPVAPVVPSGTAIPGGTNVPGSPVSPVAPGEFQNPNLDEGRPPLEPSIPEFELDTLTLTTPANRNNRVVDDLGRKFPPPFTQFSGSKTQANQPVWSSVYLLTERTWTWETGYEPTAMTRETVTAQNACDLKSFVFDSVFDVGATGARSLLQVQGSATPTASTGDEFADRDRWSQFLAPATGGLAPNTGNRQSVATVRRGQVATMTLIGRNNMVVPYEGPLLFVGRLPQGSTQLEVGSVVDAVPPNRDGGAPALDPQTQQLLDDAAEAERLTGMDEFWRCKSLGTAFMCLGNRDGASIGRGQELPPLYVEFRVKDAQSKVLEADVALVPQDETFDPAASFAAPLIDTVSRTPALEGYRLVLQDVGGWVADAGEDQEADARIIRTDDIEVANELLLDGSKTSADGRPQLFKWRQVSGPAVEWPSTFVRDGDWVLGKQISFRAPAVSTRSDVVFELRVEDGLDYARDRVKVTLRPLNHAPKIVSFTR